MRSVLNKASGLAIAVAAAAMLSSGSASAQATVIIDEFDCFFKDAVENDVQVSVEDAVSQGVISPDGTKLKITCNGPIKGLNTLQGPPVVLPSGRAIMYSGPEDGVCGGGPVFGTTTDWHQVLTKSGRASLTCRFEQ